MGKIDLIDIEKIENYDEKISLIYEFFDEENRLTSPSGSVEFITTIKYIEDILKKDYKILDLGAGCGIYSIHFAKKGYDVTSVELVKRNIEIFRKKIKENWKINLIQGNAISLPMLEDNSFDVILLFGPLYHLYSKDEQEKCLLEVRRLLKENGKIFISFINNDMIPVTETSYNANWFLKKTYNENYKVFDFPFVFHRLEDCRKLLTDVDLKIEKEIASDGFSELLAYNINKMSKENFKLYMEWHLKNCENKDKLSATNHFLFQCSQRRNIKVFYPQEDIIQNEIKDILKLPFEFRDFKKVTKLSDDKIYLSLTKFSKGDGKSRVPSYNYDIMLGDEKVGEINLRIGYTENIYYGGNIGYSVEEKHRGKGYAVIACELIKQLAKSHKMTKLIITNNLNNHSSVRVCEKLNARYIRTVLLPEYNEMRKDKSEKYVNIYIWDIA